MAEKIKYHPGFIGGLGMLLWEYRSLFSKLEQQGIGIEKRSDGVYSVQGAAPFSVQVIVGKELSSKDYAMLKVLTPDASREDLSRFHEMAFRTKDAAYRRYADSIFQVSVSANKDVYVQMTREDKKMCEALRDLLKEEFEATEARGSIKTAILLYHDEMGLKPEEISARIMDRFSLSREEAEKYLEETLGLQPV